MAIKLTAQQQAAADNRGGNLLVSAAAGSGKTRVLVERLMGYVEQGADIDRFLVITFTNAAAAELRERISSAIHQRLALDPENRHLRRSAALIYQAPICTIDAFCLDFLRQWGHLADLDPDFRLCDEAEGGQLRAQALEEVLEECYAGIEQNPGFAQLVDMLAGERDDQTVEEVVLDVYRRVQAQTDPQGWLEQRRADFLLPPGTAPEDTPWGRLLLEDSAQQVEYWLTAMTELRDEVAFDPLLESNYGASLAQTAEHLEFLRLAMDRGWDAAAELLPVPFPRLGSKRGDCDPELKERAKALREQCKKQMVKLAERFELTGEQAVEDLRAVGPAMAALLDVTARFDRRFSAKKKRRRLIDFSDAEHYAVRLLTDREGNPTPLAKEWGERYLEIMVDEYQDTNEVQNSIFNALSNGANLFMVGDVKQSIYRFRLADPTIFLEKYAAYCPWEQAREGEGRKVLLSQNFRSRPEVLDGANFVFGNVMTAQAGEIDYTEAEQLRPGREDLTPDSRFAVELHCVDLSELTDDADKGKTAKDLVEARAAARRIRELLESGMTVGERPLQPEDIVILLRSPNSMQRSYTVALDELGIPWSAEGGREFFGTTEISVAISLLQVVDNPHQDVPLLSVLRSPVFGFTPDRLAQLRAGGEGDVYDLLTQAAARGEEDCAQFLDRLEQLRLLAAQEGSHRLLWQIYTVTDLPAIFASMPEGELRRANLMALYDEACRFESGGHRGLMAFLLHLSRMSENGLSVPVPGEEGSGVRILSIHRSKGLEFPVVLLCGLERQFNESDTHATVLFHPELGLGPKRVDRSRMLRYTTLARDAVALRLRRQLRAEEMRLLYVAMTRAEHKLILFLAANGQRSGLDSLADQAEIPPSPYRMSQARSMAEWILTPALCRADCAPLRTLLGRDPKQIIPVTGHPWLVRVHAGVEYELAPAPVKPLSVSCRQEGEEEDTVAALGWKYPHLEWAQVPSKLTATQLKGRERDREVAE